MELKLYIPSFQKSLVSADEIFKKLWRHIYLVTSFIKVLLCRNFAIVVHINLAHYDFFKMLNLYLFILLISANYILYRLVISLEMFVSHKFKASTIPVSELNDGRCTNQMECVAQLIFENF